MDMDDSGQRESRRQRTDYIKSGHAMWNGIPQYQIREQDQNMLLMSTKISMLLAERDAAMEERDRALLEKRAAIAERDAAIQQRDDAISARERALLERDNALAALRFQESPINVAFGYIPDHEMKPFVQSKLRRTRPQSPPKCRDPHIAETVPLTAVSPKPARLIRQGKRKAASNAAPLSEPRRLARKPYKVGGDLNKHITKDGTETEWEAQDLSSIKEVKFCTLQSPPKCRDPHIAKAVPLTPVPPKPARPIGQETRKAASSAAPLSKPRRSARKAYKVGEDLNKNITEDGTKAEWEAHDLSSVKEMKFDEAIMPTPVCSPQSPTKCRDPHIAEAVPLTVVPPKPGRPIGQRKRKAASYAAPLSKPRRSAKKVYKVGEDLNKHITKDGTTAELEAQDLRSIKEVTASNAATLSKPRGSAQKAYKVAEDLNKHITKDGTKAEWESQDLCSIKEVKFDETIMPTPVCTCTGVARQCYKWGTGGWQSACCTTSISAYPLPLMPPETNRKRILRMAGRKMRASVYSRLLTRVAACGHDLSIPVDLRNFWAKHGTNGYIMIK